MKQWIKQRKNFITNKLRMKFIKYCIQFDIIPSHLYLIKSKSVFYHFKSYEKYLCMRKSFEIRI